MKTIKHIIVSHAIFLALFGFAALTFAQDTTDPVADREAISALRQARALEAQENTASRQTATEERKTAIQEKVQDRRTTLEARAQERIVNLAANMSNRVDAIIARMQNIIDRLSNRIEKLTEQGIDSGIATEHLATAQQSIDAARTTIANIDTEVTAATGSQNVREAWNQVKVTYLTVRNHLSNAHEEIRASVAALKEAVAEAERTGNVSKAVRSNGTDETSVIE
ncbi:hypothetical protein GW937_01480 [Candidatus Kaiserbacteria bacterium]|nr:hypothetical protein [Candidatus Kaiserbacteria bacterium]NCT01688.1 hypothetical protein [Candidatus Parcubacteria bacterium]